MRGVNDRVELAEADAVLRRRIRERHMFAGVTMIQPETIAIDVDVEMGMDLTIFPFTVIRRHDNPRSLRNGPSAYLERARLADDVIVRASTIVDATVAEGSDVGPYSHLRGQAEIGERVHVGNFAEVKNATIGNETRVGHFSYIGDATIGERTNIGAGTVTSPTSTASTSTAPRFGG